VKRLIVTADDVGLHQGMTLGAVRAHRQGIVTACSVAGAGPELSHAVTVLRDCPALEVGVHLMLVGGKPVSDPARVRTLVTRQRTFPPGYRVFLMRYALGRVSLDEVELELRAQIERVVAAGCTPTHLNGHEHLHVLPGIFDVVARLAKEYGIKYTRIPDDQRPPGTPSARRAAVSVLGVLANRARARARAAGLRVNDRTIGVVDAGRLTPARLTRLFRTVSGLVELVVHPGIGGAAIARDFPWGYDWDAETEALCDDAVREALDRLRIELVGIDGVVLHRS
jgi:predicted glycoside hydrolase/deacetylase ChbG (UPF0249 family)